MNNMGYDLGLLPGQSSPGQAVDKSYRAMCSAERTFPVASRQSVARRADIGRRIERELKVLLQERAGS